MNYERDIKPISYIKSNSAQLLDQINETKKPVVITQNGVARGVFIDAQSYQSMQDALGLMKLISQSEQEIKQGNARPSSQVFRDLKAELRNAKK